YRLF
ncbi:hypothetical protein TNIN_217961, partial [Trichonephila inaurata madagascariensis]